MKLYRVRASEWGRGENNGNEGMREKRNERCENGRDVGIEIYRQLGVKTT